MNAKLLVSLLVLAACVTPLNGQDCTNCVPVSTVHNVELYNPCGGASPGEFCIDVIRKTTQHTILWPDGQLQSAWLTAYGRSACAASCMKDWIGAPWYHRDCWPDFYSPVMTSRNYYSAAADNGTGVIMQWCSIMSYVSAVYCTGATGPLRYIGITHTCNGCPSSDMDQDGHRAISAGGDDCNDYVPFIYPGAPPVCYPGYDANCNGSMDFLEPRCINSPILIGMGKGVLELTSRDDGVLFDLDSDGTREQLSWTKVNTDDAWLCLDRNHNGMVDDGTELFGNYTPQPDPPQGSEPNGFLALAVYDTIEKGGNGNGVIDSEDPIYTELQLWRDRNHNGVSEPDELFSLDASGIVSISLDYKLSKKVDEYGNQLRYRAKVQTKANSSINKWAWDVFLLRN